MSDATAAYEASMAALDARPRPDMSERDRARQRARISQAVTLVLEDPEAAAEVLLAIRGGHADEGMTVLEPGPLFDDDTEVVAEAL